MWQPNLKKSRGDVRSGIKSDTKPNSQKMGGNNNEKPQKP